MQRLRSPFAIAAIAAVLALIALLAYGLSQNEPDTEIEQALERGERKRAPGFTLDRLSGGGEGSLADYRGRVVVLNFWASWCDPCREESPLLDRWHRGCRPAGAARCWEWTCSTSPTTRESSCASTAWTTPCCATARVTC